MSDTHATTDAGQHDPKPTTTPNDDVDPEDVEYDPADDDSDPDWLDYDEDDEEQGDTVHRQAIAQWGDRARACRRRDGAPHHPAVEGRPRDRELLPGRR